MSKNKASTSKTDLMTAAPPAAPSLYLHSHIPEIMTKQDVANILGISDRQVERYIAERKLRASRLSHKVLRIRKEDLQRFMDRNGT